MVEPNNKQISVAQQCRLLNLPRSSYYRQPDLCQESPENLILMRLIDEEYTRHPFYGTRKIRHFLQQQGYSVNRKRVQRLMRKMVLQSVAPKRNTSKRQKADPVYPYLLKGIEIKRINQVWSTDITYVRLAKGFVYLAAVIDWYSRKVLSWDI